MCVRSRFNNAAQGYATYLSFRLFRYVDLRCRMYCKHRAEQPHRTKSRRGDDDDDDDDDETRRRGEKM